MPAGCEHSFAFWTLAGQANSFDATANFAQTPVIPWCTEGQASNMSVVPPIWCPTSQASLVWRLAECSLGKYLRACNTLSWQSSRLWSWAGIVFYQRGHADHGDSIWRQIGCRTSDVQKQTRMQHGWYLSVWLGVSSSASSTNATQPVWIQTIALFSHFN